MRLSLTKRQVYVALLLAAALVLSACTAPYNPPLPRGDDRGVVEKGETLYAANCQKCHGDATGGKLRDIPPPHNANGHTWHHADQQLIEMTLNGISFSAEAQRMPAFKDLLSEEEVKAILAYIKTWWTQEQREWQRKVTEQWGQ